MGDCERWSLDSKERSPEVRKRERGIDRKTWRERCWGRTEIERPPRTKAHRSLSLQTGHIFDCVRCPATRPFTAKKRIHPTNGLRA